MATRERVAANLRAFVEMIEKGVFLIIPGRREGPSYCNYCDFRLACRRSHAPSRWRAENAEARRRLDRLRTGAPAEELS